MKNWLKSLFLSSKNQNSLIKPLKNQNFLKPSNNSLSNTHQKGYNSLTNPLDFSNAQPLMPKSLKKPKDEPEYKNYWLEKWYAFRDKRLAYPLDRLAYAIRVALQVVINILFRSKLLMRTYERLIDKIYQAQMNKKLREYAVPGLIVCVTIIIFLSI